MSYAHWIRTDPTNRFAFLPHVAESNTIFQFHFDEASGQLTPNTPAQITPAPGTGPRHYVYHPGKAIGYFSNEQGSSVTGYHLDTKQGTLTPFQNHLHHRRMAHVGYDARAVMGVRQWLRSAKHPLLPAPRLGAEPHRRRRDHGTLPNLGRGSPLGAGGG